MVNRRRLWTIAGLILAVLTAVVFAVLQFTGVIEDPIDFACHMMRRRCNP